MSMVNMAMTAEEAKEYSSPCAPCSDEKGPRYPYGLCLSLDDSTIKKLGITLPEVGSELQVTAKVVVTSVGMSQVQDGEKEQRCELQITDMALSAPVRSVDAAAMYSNSHMEK